jgi:DNA-binding transcriptional LysR family regulator
LAVVTAPGVRSLAAALGSGDVRIVVLRAGCSYRQRLEEALARRGIAAPRILEFGTLEAIFRCVGAGLGITLLPRSLIGRVWEAGLVAVHTLPEREGRVETLFIRRGDGYVSGALAAFLRHVRGGASGARSRRNLATSAGPAPRGP